MAHDDDKPEAGDDPWAGLEADTQSDSEPDFSFSFDDDAGADEAIVAGPSVEESVVAGSVSEGQPMAEAAAEELSFGAAEAAIDPALDDALAGEPDVAFESLLAAEAPLEDGEVDAAAASASGAMPESLHEGPGDADIDDWLSGAAEAEASASSVFPAGGFAEPEHETDGFPDFEAGESTVSIGTGTSGISSPSSIEAPGGSGSLAASQPAAEDEGLDPFAGLGADDDGGWPAAEAGDASDAASPADVGGDMFSFKGQAEGADAQEESPFAAISEAEQPEGVTEAGDDFGAGFDMGAGARAAGAAAATAVGGDDAKRAPAKAKRPAPPRKKKPSMIGQLVGVVLGGAMAIPVTMAILIWGFGRDPFNLTPMVPDSVAFLLPAKFRPAGSDTIPNAPSLDDIVGKPAPGDGEAALPSGDDLPMTEPEPVAPVEPEPTDVAAVDPAAAPGNGGTEGDPLMNLLDESGGTSQPPVPVEPPPPPEPEPLDLEKLGVAVAEVTAGLEAVAAIDDPSDPVRRKLMAKWYKSLAGYAEELAALERLATETGRPFEPAVEQGDAIRTGLADHPQLLAELSRLTRDWIAYGKRPSDGVVMPASFVGARRVGPYWRSQVRLAATDKQPALELVVLTRSEPAVAPGDEVVITGLTVDDNVVWATELRSAAGESGIPGL